MREGTTSRVMATDAPYGEFYDFYNVSPEYFGYKLVCVHSHYQSEFSTECHLVLAVSISSIVTSCLPLLFRLYVTNPVNLFSSYCKDPILCTYLLTYFLAPWSRVFLEKLTGL
jgi:hypothetical protein